MTSNKENKETVRFKIAEESGFSMSFKMNISDPVRKAINAYLERTNKDPKGLRFVHEGQMIDQQSFKDTPQSLGMEDGDTIDVHPETDGGF